MHNSTEQTYIATKQMKIFKIGLITLFAWIQKMGLTNKIQTIMKTYFPVGKCKMVNENGEHHILLKNTICQILYQGQEINNVAQICAVCPRKIDFKC